MRTKVETRCNEENKIPEVYDDGYGNWMEKNTNPEIEQKKLFQNGFNPIFFPCNNPNIDEKWQSLCRLASLAPLK